MGEHKTTEAQRRAISKYQETIDRINCRFPKGTKDRITATGSSVNAFIIKAVLEALEQEERKAGDGPTDPEGIKVPFMD